MPRVPSPSHVHVRCPTAFRAPPRPTLSLKLCAPVSARVRARRSHAAVRVRRLPLRAARTRRRRSHPLVQPPRPRTSLARERKKPRENAKARENAKSRKSARACTLRAVLVHASPPAVARGAAVVPAARRPAVITRTSPANVPVVRLPCCQPPPPAPRRLRAPSSLLVARRPRPPRRRIAVSSPALAAVRLASSAHHVLSVSARVSCVSLYSHCVFCDAAVHGHPVSYASQ